MSARKPAGAPSGDTRLVVTDFGPIASAEVTLRPLTVFVGPNHTGKSVLATLLYALHRNAFWRALTERGSWSAAAQRPEAAPSLVAEPAPSWLEQTEASSAVSPETEPALRARCEAEAARALAAEVCRCFGVADAGRLRRRPGSRPGSSPVAAIEWRTSAAANAPSVRFEFGDGAGTAALSARLSNLASIPAVDPRAPGASFGAGRRPEDPSPASFLEERFRSLLRESFGPALRTAYFLPADRSGIVRHALHRDSFPEAAPAESRRAGHGPLVSGVTTDLLEQLDAIRRNAADRPRRNPLAAELENRILGGSIRVEPNAGGTSGITYRPGKWRSEHLPLHRTSALASSLAPVVLWLRHLVGPGEVLIIEEPEVGLHPEMQVALARELSRMIRAGIRVVLTTHSEWLTEKIANLVQLRKIPATRRAGFPDAAYALDPAEVGVWLFRQRPEQEGAVVEEVTVEPESGLFPVGYEDVARALYNQSAEIYNRTGDADD